MYICPICKKEFPTEDAVVKHYLKCWKEKNPYQTSKSAPCNSNISTRKVNEDVTNFFNSFQKR